MKFCHTNRYFDLLSIICKNFAPIDSKTKKEDILVKVYD